MLLVNVYIAITYHIHQEIDYYSSAADIFLFREYDLVSILGQAIYFITLGILLWLFILSELITYFRINSDNGLLLTHLSKSYKRTNYFSSIILGIYFAILTIVFINLFLAYLSSIIIFQYSSISLFKMLIVGLIYAIFHVAFIIIVLSFISVVIRRTEYALILSVVIATLSCFSIFVKTLLVSVDIDNSIILNSLLIITYADSYPYFYLTRNIFIIFNEKLVQDISFFNQFQLFTRISIDPDLQFVLYEKMRTERFISKFIMWGVFLIHGWLLYTTQHIFKKMDISGN